MKKMHVLETGAGASRESEQALLRCMVARGERVLHVVNTGVSSDQFKPSSSRSQFGPGTVAWQHCTRPRPALTRVYKIS